MMPFTDIPPGVIRPLWIWQTATQGGTEITLDGGPAQGLMQVILGIDVWGAIQPNNGDFVLSLNDPATNGSARDILQIQQSQNFPGPWFWRGFIPLYSSTQYLAASGSVPFGFSIWGVEMPDPRMDI